MILTHAVFPHTKHSSTPLFTSKLLVAIMVFQASQKLLCRVEGWVGRSVFQDSKAIHSQRKSQYIPVSPRVSNSDKCQVSMDH